jgi:tRNA(Arg) A34 adenosine deaminase TadA
VAVPDHERYMRRAIQFARGNPGALIADHDTGEVLSEGLNDARRSPVLHGETEAILRFADTRPDADWTRLILYTTVEPCPMCAGAILWSGIPRLVFGTSVQTLKGLGLPQIDLPAREVADRAYSSFERLEITGGVLEGECDALFQDLARRPGTA